ncbi:hypothetical protein SAMD00019534_007090 [Acytostelium subglobosum LB1]|uniref:hypothetical protein n=1 Tax=Acytostelium subglobosum LB1 TaxID=1410327 RepID=UPI000644825E|nr:hypothetical protein SAMD00019534_007090 [Acytostelium subglobosum LB1]GAM17534.1 hypothetical protein SAMD00019534_007090 [Acytostelium subglobosum LB1]|eukprot:XP_012759596.1 hypothetical protein SAMD00019534_007090 [Acytostelium subglobosum LB1]
MKRVYIFTNEQFKDRKGYDVYLNVDGMDKNSYSTLCEQVLSIASIESIVFEDYPLKQFGHSFWLDINDMLLALSQRSHPNNNNNNLGVRVSYNKVSDPERLPSTLHLSRMSIHYVESNTFSSDHIPSTLTHLSINGLINKPLDFILPQSLRTLDLSGAYNWNQPMAPGGLPARLEIIRFGHSFDQPIQKGALPSTIKDVSFGDMFDQPLSGDNLPPALTKLGLGECSFRHRLTGLPVSLVDLSLGANYNHVIDHPMLVHLATKFSKPSLDNLVMTYLKVLRFMVVTVDTLSKITSAAYPCLETLTTTSFNENSSLVDVIDLSNLPSTLLNVYIMPNIAIKSLPDSVESIVINALRYRKSKSSPSRLCLDRIPSSTKYLDLNIHGQKLHDIVPVSSTTWWPRRVSIRTEAMDRQEIIDLLEHQLLNTTIIQLSIYHRPQINLLRISPTLFFRYTTNSRVSGSGFTDVATVIGLLTST